MLNASSKQTRVLFKNRESHSSRQINPAQFPTWRRGLKMKATGQCPHKSCHKMKHKNELLVHGFCKWIVTQWSDQQNTAQEQMPGESKQITSEFCFMGKSNTSLSKSLRLEAKNSGICDWRLGLCPPLWTVQEREDTEDRQKHKAHRKLECKWEGSGDRSGQSRKDETGWSGK